MVREYERSGLSRKEFSLQRGLAVGTLDRYRKLLRQTLDGGDGSNRWVGVELSGPKPIGGSELAVVLPSGRRIEGVDRSPPPRTLGGVPHQGVS